MKSFSKSAALFSLLAFMGGCTYSGDDIGNPFYRKVQWFSFLGGEDLASACAPGTPDRFRLIYNAIWDRQVRVYEWDSAGRDLKIRVLGTTGNVAEFKLNDPISPWRAEESKAHLDQAAYDGLIQSLTQSQAFGPPAVGLQLPSHSYYWTAAACHQGRFTFTAWAYPSPAFDAATFPARLAALDPGRETIAAAAPIPVDVIWEYNRNRGAALEFTLKVGAQGLDYGFR